MNIIGRLNKTWSTVKYMKPSQIFHRIVFMGKRKFAYPFRIITANRYDSKAGSRLGLEMPGHSITYADQNPHQNWNSSRMDNFMRNVKSVQQYRFAFLNNEYRFDGDIDWHVKSQSHLWRYNLHYFEYGIELGYASKIEPHNESYYETFKALVDSWIKGNPRLGIGDGWHPYTISLRLVHWAYAYDLFRSRIDQDPAFKSRFIQSYAKQGLFLYDNVEWDVLGNHVIENGRGLVFAGLLLDIPLSAKLLNKGCRILWWQLEAQVLPDGGHYERSPMYHQIVLKDYLEVIRLLRIYNRPIPSEVNRKVQEMLLFHDRTLHPDGDIALFNDSAFGIAPSASSIRLLAEEAGFKEAYATDLRSTLLDDLLVSGKLLGNRDTEQSGIVPFAAKETGYFTAVKDDLFIIADAGASCPDFLPAHAHADFGSFELSVGTRRWIVDSGVYHYQGEYRNVFRGTAAHNCLMINQTNQSDVWGNFRLASRAKPTYVQWEDKPDIWSISAVHNGYRRFGVTPIRKMFLLNRNILIVLDEITGKKGFEANSLVHFHSGIEVVPSGSFFQSVADDRTMFIYPFGSDRLNAKLQTGMYSPQFGKKADNAVLNIEAKGDAGRQVVGYVLSAEQVNVRFAKSKTDHYSLEIGNSLLKIKFGPRLDYRIQE
ncbi:heparinase II/III family protein [Cohnella sp. GCM10027633]|uniref:heparinase II/III family protein n=1 Tax=unclassified Cohnella TaxID=2636738 RepID=UPI00362926AC